MTAGTEAERLMQEKQEESHKGPAAARSHSYKSTAQMV